MWDFPNGSGPYLIGAHSICLIGALMVSPLNYRTWYDAFIFTVNLQIQYSFINQWNSQAFEPRIKFSLFSPSLIQSPSLSLLPSLSEARGGAEGGAGAEGLAFAQSAHHQGGGRRPLYPDPRGREGGARIAGTARERRGAGQ